ncbi:hypothetical protein CC80DRAFT_104203 [Byssothecium circinans]|uniref:Uncharacterized protein n=1 Tax=Byssothecium circinans TaxID=147558 RepID=A0A6A5UDR3_9PLEO|nr:hypothetical protein CC80DRAFT_104203 [Byssothecium circinans]
MATWTFLASPAPFRHDAILISLPPTSPKSFLLDFVTSGTHDRRTNRAVVCASGACFFLCNINSVYFKSVFRFFVRRRAGIGPRGTSKYNSPLHEA